MFLQEAKDSQASAISSNYRASVTLKTLSLGSVLNFKNPPTATISSLLNKQSLRLACIVRWAEMPLWRRVRFLL